MKANFEPFMDWIFQREGEYSNDPEDIGGETCFGISRVFHPNWVGWITVDFLKREWGKLPTGDSLLMLLQEDVYDFYREQIWNASRCGDLPSGVDLFVADMATHQGVEKAAKSLQEAVGVVRDGVVGPKTLQAASALLPGLILRRMAAVRFYEYMISSSNKKKYGKGFGNRFVEAIFLAQGKLE